MKAGFAKFDITPPVGTAVSGVALPETDTPSTSNHDDLFVRALYLSHEGEEALIVEFDLLFLSREESDRFKGAIGNKLDMAPRQILLSASHTHCAPMVGVWALSDYKSPDRLYLREIESALVAAACRAKENAVDVEMWAGVSKSSLPMNRRRLSEEGVIENRPNPGGIVYDKMPVCLLSTPEGEPVCLLFSISCHPSMLPPYDMSAEFPGVAMHQLDEYLGKEASLFLQGTAGDAKPTVIGKGESHWRKATWDDMYEAGDILANEVIDTLRAGLERVEPEIRSAITELQWPLELIPDRAGYVDIADKPLDPWKHALWRMWAERMVERLDRGEELPTFAPIIIHGLKLGSNLRVVGIEGEPVAELGIIVDNFFAEGITFPLGYTDGSGLYLPTSDMLDEGGYEVRSFYEYGHPARLAKGIETLLPQSLEELRAKGIS